jgi:hypothetical protein
VPHEQLDEGGRAASGAPSTSPAAQGGLVALPILAFPTGIMRGRFHPTNGQLYVCGMFAWAGNATEPGGLYCIRYTGRPLYVPKALRVRHNGTGRAGVELTFTGALDPATAADPDSYRARAWSLRRTSNYGSDHHDERRWPVAAVELSSDGRTVFLEIPDLEPTWCAAVTWDLKAADGTPVKGEMHHTVHRVQP